MLRDGTSSPFHLGAFSSLKKSYWHWAACMAFQLSQGTAPVPTASSRQEQRPPARRALHAHTTSQRKAGAPPHGQSGELEPPWHLRLSLAPLLCSPSVPGLVLSQLPSVMLTVNVIRRLMTLAAFHSLPNFPKVLHLNPRKPSKCQIHLLIRPNVGF